MTTSFSSNFAATPANTIPAITSEFAADIAENSEWYDAGCPSGEPVATTPALGVAPPLLSPPVDATEGGVTSVSPSNKPRVRPFQPRQKGLKRGRRSCLCCAKAKRTCVRDEGAEGCQRCVVRGWVCEYPPEMRTHGRQRQVMERCAAVGEPYTPVRQARAARKATPHGSTPLPAGSTPLPVGSTPLATNAATCSMRNATPDRSSPLPTGIIPVVGSDEEIDVELENGVNRPWSFSSEIPDFAGGVQREGETLVANGQDEYLEQPEWDEWMCFDQPSASSSPQPSFPFSSGIVSNLDVPESSHPAGDFDINAYLLGFPWQEKVETVEPAPAYDVPSSVPQDTGAEEDVTEAETAQFQLDLQQLQVCWKRRGWM